jgi:hypothetical protein
MNLRIQTPMGLFVGPFPIGHGVEICLRAIRGRSDGRSVSTTPQSDHLVRAHPRIPPEVRSAKVSGLTAPLRPWSTLPLPLVPVNPICGITTYGQSDSDSVLGNSGELGGHRFFLRAPPLPVSPPAAGRGFHTLSLWRRRACAVTSLGSAGRALASRHTCERLGSPARDARGGRTRRVRGAGRIAPAPHG